MKTLKLIVLFLMVYVSANCQIIDIDFKYYTAKFSIDKKQSVLTFYRLTSDMLVKKCERSNYFYNDLNIEMFESNDYRGSGFDRGHLVPAGDMLFDSVAMKESFSYANISFQTPALNRGIWKNLETLIRADIREFDTAYIYTGPIFDLDSPNDFIPRYFFKSVVIKRKGSFLWFTFIIPNLKDKSLFKSLSEYAYSIDFLESVIDVDLFNFLDIEHLEMNN